MLKDDIGKKLINNKNNKKLKVEEWNIYKKIGLV